MSEKERLPATEIEWLHAKVEDLMGQIGLHRNALEWIRDNNDPRNGPASLQYQNHHVAVNALMTRKERGYGN